MRMILIFIDGFGIGEKDPEKNPCCIADMRHFEYLMDRYGLICADATLGVEGLPQSATGQTTLYTGVNASKAIGKHWSARPTHELEQIIMEDNLFLRLKRHGRTVTFANVYSAEYLEKMKTESRGIFRPSVTSLLCLSSDTPFRVLEDYMAKRGVFHDITGRMLIENGYDVPLRTPEEAAKILYGISRDFDLTLFEFFMTDIQGHSGDREKAVYELELLNRMLGRLIQLVDLREDVILITSDHGNIEDLSVKTHTFNPVPVIIAGDAVDRKALDIRSLTDVMPAILKMFGIPNEKKD